MAIKKEKHLVVNCANCRIPLAFNCFRTKLSNEIYTLPNSLRQTLLYDLFSQIFKLRQTVINNLSWPIKHFELCRYCTNNFLNLLKYYSKILKVSNETESLFSRLIVQSKGRPGRPPKKPVEVGFGVESNPCSQSFTAVLPTKPKSDLDIDIDIEIDSHLLEDEDAPLGLQYLGLVRKKRTVDVDVDLHNHIEGNDNNDNETNGQKRSKSTRIRSKCKNGDTEVTSLNLGMDLLLPDYNDAELVSPSESNLVNGEIVCIDETLKEPIFSSPDKIQILQEVVEEQEVEENDPIPCTYCEKTFRHAQRLHNHIKTHHKTLLSEEVEDITVKLEGESSSRQRHSRNSNAKFVLIKKKRGRPPKYPIKASTSQTSKGNTSSVNSTLLRGKIKKLAGKKTTTTRVTGGGKIEKLKKQNHREEFICKICKKKFKQIQFLNQHMKVHSNDKRCSECEKKFKSAALLKRHMQIHAKDNTVFKCDDCQREFPNLLGLQVHAVAHTRTLYTCKGCKRKFKIEKNFIQHQETARCTEKKHACPTCGKLFKNKDKVKRHLISMHSETKPFGCELCGKGFRSLADLKFHEVNAHICGETKQYQCDQCGKRFKSVETLKSHEMYSHKMEKKHFCSICGKGFPLLATLKIHEISHSTERPYMCTYCGRTYKHANDLKSHEVVHYKDEEKPFVCPICGNRYHRKDVLRLHQGREKHFGPDVPIQPMTKKPSASATVTNKSKRAGSAKISSISPSKILKLEHFDVLDKTDVDVIYESGDGDGDSNVSGTPLVSTSTESDHGSSGISVIQNLNAHQQITGNSHGHSFVQSQLSSVMQLQQSSLPHSNTLTVTQHQHLIPIMQHSSVNPMNTNQPTTLGAISQSSFGVPMTMTPVNEAISDFYRIMYDLT